MAKYTARYLLGSRPVVTPFVCFGIAHRTQDGTLKGISIMVGQIKPVQTFYKNYHFRSRLEARYAVMFDSLGLNWEYEKDTYALPHGWYLPDFWFVDLEVWAEVKPFAFTELEEIKARELSVVTERNVILLDSLPENRAYDLAIGSRYWDRVCLTNDNGRTLYNHAFPNGSDGDWFADTEIAVKAALSARFEHGQKGASYAARAI